MGIRVVGLLGLLDCRANGGGTLRSKFGDGRRDETDADNRLTGALRGRGVSGLVPAQKGARAFGAAIYAGMQDRAARTCVN